MSTTLTPETTEKAAAEREDQHGEGWGRFALVGVLVVLFIAFSIARPESFGTIDNAQAILNNQVTVIFLALAVTLPLIVDEFDLSVAATFSFSQLLTVGLVLNQGWAPPLAIALALVASVLVGIVNGIAITKYQINSFIVTLATGSLLSGASLAYSKGETIFGAAPTSLTNISRSELLGLRLPVFYAAIAVVVLVIVLNNRPTGRKMYATGSNKRAATLSGIPVNRYVLTTFAVSGLLAGIGGVILGASIGSATPSTGNALLIPAFAGAFLGATTILPGRFNVLGSVVAVLVVGVAVAGLQQIGVALWVEPVFNGLVLFIAVGLSAWTAQRRKRRAERARLREIEARRS